MKKKLLTLALAGCAVFVMGCSGTPEASEVATPAVETSATVSQEASAAVQTGADAKVNDLAEKLNQDVEHGETLTKLDGAGLERVYRIGSEDVAAAAGYTGSGATVDQISVWKAADDAAADRIWDTLRDFLDTQIESYSSYMPDEVPKLENAVLERSGEYIALCISEDSAAAREIITESFAA